MSVLDVLRECRPKIAAVTVSSGRPVYVKGFNGARRHLFTQLGKEDGGAPIHIIAALGLCQEDGTLVFDCSTEKGIALAKMELTEVDSKDLELICLKLYEVSGLTLNAVEEAEKKSEASQSA